MVEEQKVASARRAALVAIALAVAMMFTSIAVVATGAQLPVWLLWAEGFALISTALLIRADLRIQQRHIVK
jgi:hypothetical protein